MTAQQDPYVRVYYRVIDDPKFADVFDDDARLACWLRLLLIADGTYPAPAPIPHGVKRAAFAHLVKVGLVDQEPGNRFRIHGMDAERGARSRKASDAARKRWTDAGGDAVAMRPHSGSNASASDTNMHSAPLLSEPLRSAPLRAETGARTDETNRHGLPHIDPETQAVAERVSGRSLSTLHGHWATELDRLTEDRGAHRVQQSLRKVGATFPEKPSWPQLVAGVRNDLEPLPSSGKAMTEAERKDAEIQAAIAQIKAETAGVTA